MSEQLLRQFEIAAEAAALRAQLFTINQTRAA